MPKKHKRTWTLGMAKHWKKYKPYARPSKSELTVFERYFRKASRKHGRILILGSTPEFRDLAQKHSLDTYCADISKENFLELRKLMKRKKEAASSEKLIHSDWIKLRTHLRFDLIVGDWAINMIPVKKYNPFLKAVSTHLKDNGFFVHRHGVWYPGDRKKADIKRIVADFRKKHKGEDFYQVKGLDMFRYFWNWKKMHVDFSKYVPGIEELHHKGILNDAEAKDLEFQRPNKTAGLCASMLMKKDFDKKVDNYFKIIKEERSTDLWRKNVPIYVMKVKR
ncbi:MAG TPA: hypothetical protein VJC00_03445 [Candidatus Nanoarchaeia archaeon]|nr:hypothetical protein [Candidatus Nanoarchaeia archaeon]